MKHTFYIIALVAFTTPSCNSNLKARISQLEKENEELQNENKKLAETANVFELLEKLQEEDMKAKKYPVEETMTAEEYAAKSMDRINLSENQTLIDAAVLTSQKSKEMLDYIQSIKDMLARASGGYNTNGQLVNPRDLEAINTIIFDQGHGLQLEEKILSLISHYDSVVAHSGGDEEEVHLPLRLSSNDERRGKSWVEFNFMGMIVGATFPIFSKLRNDVQSSELIVLKRLAAGAER